MNHVFHCGVSYNLLGKIVIFTYMDYLLLRHYFNFWDFSCSTVDRPRSTINRRVNHLFLCCPTCLTCISRHIVLSTILSRSILHVCHCFHGQPCYLPSFSRNYCPIPRYTVLCLFCIKVIFNTFFSHVHCLHFFDEPSSVFSSSLSCDPIFLW